ncbi:PQQ-binding-like beta-propeller repeat protein [Halorubellus sp. PRR65]|uniref:PQQ-binding-like beta-propeller repeat protein n=1 Tax=Halorubellus sp. PRR65 TaxID=3098148 RepID=UPI002B2580CE|nr:PQQ-binding-like beta-propeller repeat protein [Halorubellus sp. PRR65]
MPPSPPPTDDVPSRSTARLRLRDRAVSRRDVLAATGSAAVAALAGCLGTEASAASDAPWPMQGHDAGRTNHRADASPPRGDLGVAWEHDRSDHWPVTNQPVAYDDLVVFPAHGLVAVGREDGGERFALHPTGRGLAVAAADGYRTPTLVAGGTRVVAGLDATGGVDTGVGKRVAERWRAGTDDDGGLFGGGNDVVAGTTPVAVDGVVYHASPRAAVVARDAASGRERWRYVGERREGFFAVDEHVYVAAFGESVRALDPADGSVVWTHRERGGHPNRWTGVAAADGDVFVNDGRGVTALDATDGGTVRWRTGDGERTDVETDYGVPSVVDDRVLLSGFDAVYGFDRETGERVWKRALDPSDPRHVAAAGDLAFVPTERGELVALDAATGRTAWEFGRPDAWDVGSPVVADGRVYAAFGEKLVCLEGSR